MGEGDKREQREEMGDIRGRRKTRRMGLRTRKGEGCFTEGYGKKNGCTEKCKLVCQIIE